jgi:hypothetical protein
MADDKKGWIFVCKSLDKLITAVLLCITSIPRLCPVMLVVVANTKGISNNGINASRKSNSADLNYDFRLLFLYAYRVHLYQ